MCFDHVRIACSLTEFDFQYMLFTFGLISYLMGCSFIFFFLLFEVTVFLW